MADSSLEVKYTEIAPKDITDGEVVKKAFGDEERLVWEGKGMFDILLHTIYENLRVEYDNGRITGAAYAQTYAQLISVALDKAIQVLATNIELKMNSELNKLKQENIRAQTKVYERQIEGFSDNLKIKLFQAQLDAFSMIYSSGMLDFDQNADAFPKALKAKNLSETYDLLYNSAIANWDNDPVTKKSKYSVERRIAKGGEESGIKL